MREPDFDALAEAYWAKYDPAFQDEEEEEEEEDDQSE